MGNLKDVSCTVLYSHKPVRIYTVFSTISVHNVAAKNMHVQSTCVHLFSATCT